MDKKKDYSFMKSGLDLVNNVEPHDPELMLQVASLVSAFASNALRESAVYVEHAKRKVITADDIKLCLKAETFKFLDRGDIMENVNKWRDIIQEDIEKELNGDVESDYEDEEEEINEEFKLSECECEMCKNVNGIEAVWEQWIPQTPIELALKKTIDTKL